MPDLPEYRVYALRYATRPGRRAEHFLGGDPHDGPMPLDYFVWAIVGAGRVFVVDTGFEPDEAARRNRVLLRRSGEALAAVGVSAAAATDVIVTHMHYDHLGGFGQFPAARFHVQDREMAFATGRHMQDAAHGHAYTADHVAELVRHVYAGRVAFHDGDAELAPGLSVHHVGGHTAGHQVVRVRTRIGWLVLASDAAHFYENMETARPFPIVWNLADVHAAYARCRALASDPAFVVPGHDPLVCRYYAPETPAPDGIAYRLDAEPRR